MKKTFIVLFGLFMFGGFKVDHPLVVPMDGSHLHIPRANLTLEIELQPVGQPSYVTNVPGKVTLFRQTLARNALVFIIHNDLGGTRLYDTKIGDLIYVSSAQDRVYYEVIHIYRFRADQPTDPFSDLFELETGERFTVDAAYDLVFPGGYVTIETCIIRNGDVNWGRIFIQAKQIKPPDFGG